MKRIKDEQIKLSEAIFSNISFIKLYLLENYIVKKLCDKRAKELAKWMDGFCDFSQNLLFKLMSPIYIGLILAL